MLVCLAVLVEYKNTHLVLFHLYEMSRIGKFIETES